MRALRGVLAAAALGGCLGGVAGCGGGDATSTAAGSGSTAGSAVSSAYVQTLRDDKAAFSAALDQVTAACPVPKVTIQTMKDCKQTLLALIKVDNAARQHLSGSEVPTKLQAAATGLGDALKTLNAAQLAIIRNYIDKDDIPGFKGSGGTGSPIDNAILAAKSAFDALQLQASGG